MKIMFLIATIVYLLDLLFEYKAVKLMCEVCVKNRCPVHFTDIISAILRNLRQIH